MPGGAVTPILTLNFYQEGHSFWFSPQESIERLWNEKEIVLFYWDLGDCTPDLFCEVCSFPSVLYFLQVTQCSIWTSGHQCLCPRVLVCQPPLVLTILDVSICPFDACPSFLSHGLNQTHGHYISSLELHLDYQYLSLVLGLTSSISILLFFSWLALLELIHCPIITQFPLGLLNQLPGFSNIFTWYCSNANLQHNAM